MNDVANSRALSRSRLGLSRELQQQRTDLPPDPSIGGTRGYPVWFRMRVLATSAQIGQEAAAEQWGCSTRSIVNWNNRLEPYRMTGGVERSAITGMDQLMLAIGLFIYPNATADQLCMFIYANGGDVYTRVQITNRCNELNITRKRSSKEAYDAFSPRSLEKLYLFQTHPPPLGVFGIPIWRLIDIDETGFYLSDCGSNYGRGYSCCRVRVPAHYTRKEAKLNVLAGIEAGNPNLPPHVDGSVERPRRWYKVTYENCDMFSFGAFCDEICTDIETDPVPGGYDDERVFMWDGLNVHDTPYVIQMIQGRPSHNVFHTVTRPPYRPKMGPIEYIFCELAGELDKRVRREWRPMDLRRNICQIMDSLGFERKFHNTFTHCGYPIF